jgi:hypothetical protein
MESSRLGRDLERMVARAKRLVDESGTMVPVDLVRLARLQGVQRIIESSSLSNSGRLMRVGRSLVVVLNRRESRERRNFTLCHEIAHTFNLDGNDKSRMPTATNCNTRSLEEYLCDRAASELLMPERFFRPLAASLQPTAASVEKLARTFGASISATMMRIGTLGCWRVMFIVWAAATPLGSSKKLRVRWSIPPRHFAGFVPKHAGVGRQSGIHAVFTSGGQRRQVEVLDLGSLRGSYLVESARFGSYVVSIVHQPDRREVRDGDWEKWGEGDSADQDE